MPLQILKNIVKKLAFPIKLLVTIALSTLIIWKGDWGTIWKALQSSDPFLILCVFASMVFCVTISAFKWQLLLSIHGIHIDFGKLHKYYFTALFFNNFFPTNIGGDGYRIYKTLQNQHTKAGAIISVFTEAHQSWRHNFCFHRTPHWYMGTHNPCFDRGYGAVITKIY
jgi:uncharacterized membrane protein YbhN (UPF0104 family)